MIDGRDDDDENRPLMANHHDDEAGGRGRLHTDGTSKNTLTSTTVTPEDASSSAASALYHTNRDDGDTPLPRFLRDQQQQQQDSNNDSDDSSRRGRKWPTWVPYPVERTARAVAQWTRGPPDAQPYRIRPFLPAVQEFPLRAMDRFLPGRRRRRLLLFLYLAVWVVAFALLKRQEYVAGEIAGGWGRPQAIGCGAAYFSRSNLCGLDGADCRPFNGSSLAFRCPANCASYRVLNPRAVGDQEVVYRPLIVGGPTTDLDPIGSTLYRGDSYICGAAVHAGVVSNTNGGCGVVQLVGRQQGFVASDRNGIASVAFDSYFPLSFRFVPVNCHATDERFAILALSVAFTTVLGLATASPAAFYFPAFVGAFWTVGMATDAPSYATAGALFSNILGKFVPAMFTGWVIYDKMGVRRTLAGLTAQVEKVVLWLGACWVGALENYTLDFIPIQRLSAHDLAQQPGARAALAVIVIALFFIVLYQAWCFRQEARFNRYIKLYALLLAGILLSLALPGLNLRIHHYVLALLLLPGTSMQTRPALLYQGLLVGLFINGIARWGFGSFLETDAALQNDAQLGSLLPSVGAAPAVVLGNAGNAGARSNITFAWDLPPRDEYDGISILVNDVERYRAYFDDTDAPAREYTWTRNASLGLPEYFRFGFMADSTAGDYTKAGVWSKDGEWTHMAAGPSR
ncbi:LCCL domain containing protein [Cordyceps fumosorosea ARSEF 2679]|uniref:LCCL domain containing protein n=1 Tax=Cordyceps fumosorosea (strain ARSEF 2679) TaxID=1081104 RepID=A0A167YC63_CORFA|nr:LCCL domain containing protein [Cordyceps fumosorosea ARSEF 2679]OAA66145.1 LCCL domain containing protein [Cordyceps fumosorosea ARSEF 2679]